MLASAMPSAVAAGFQRLNHRVYIGILLFTAAGYNLVAGVQHKQVVDMPVPAVAGDILRGFVFPLHELAAQPNLRAGKLRLRGFDLVDFF